MGEHNIKKGLDTGFQSGVGTVTIQFQCQARLAFHNISKVADNKRVRATGEIGDFVIVNESAVAAGVRSIETVTGFAAQKYLRSRAQVLDEAAKLLHCQPDEVRDRIDTMLQERKSIEQDVAKF